MKEVIIFIFLFSISSLQILAAIYGEDDRQLTFNSDNSEYRHAAKSVLAQLRSNVLIREGDTYQLTTKPLNQHVQNLCTDAPFAQTPTFARCTAFLVAPNLIVTAGHCINNQEECDQANWVFTSHLNPKKSNHTVAKQEVVSCKKLLAHRKNTISKNDYALIEIEEEIKHRPILSFRKEGNVSPEESFFVIGHPTGLALIVTDAARIIKNNTKFLFRINSDTFGGNSGSPVINSRTGLVEGILTDGDLDYTLDKKKGCMMPFLCPFTGCKGENVVRITNLELLVPDREPLIEPIFNPRTPRL